MLFTKFILLLLATISIQTAAADAACLQARDVALKLCKPPAQGDQGEMAENTIATIDSSADSTQNAAIQTAALNERVAATAMGLAAACETGITDCEVACKTTKEPAAQEAYKLCRQELRMNLMSLNSSANAAVMASAMAQRSVAASQGDRSGEIQTAQATRHYIFEKIDDPYTQFTVPMGDRDLTPKTILPLSPGFKCIRNCN